jgi:hypothetical protein
VVVLKLQEPSRNLPSVESHPSAQSPQQQQQGASQESVWVAAVREEVDGYLVTLRTLNSHPPDEVFALLSGISARLVELRVISHRSESRRLTALRSHEIDPLLEQCDRAFRLHSRIQATRQMEWDAMRGQT